jgi:hypothetical protein
MLLGVPPSASQRTTSDEPRQCQSPDVCARSMAAVLGPFRSSLQTECSITGSPLIWSDFATC